MTAADPRVEAHYDRFPYPRPDRIRPPASPVHTAGILSHLCRRRAEDAFGARPAVWVAGCGTQQATTWARTFPEGRVHATDVSSVTLTRAAARAAKLGVTDVTWQQEDLLTCEPEPRFDLVVCTGVVHHLPDPEEGLRRLGRGLLPHGALILMVYARAHRELLAPLRRAARLLAEGARDPYGEACRALDAALGPGASPAARPLLESLHALKAKDPSFVADVLLHPLEVCYDAEELFALVARAGLRVADWLYPGAWRPSVHLEDAVLARRMEALDVPARARLLQDLLGLASPMLELVLERGDAPARPAYTREERLAMPLVCSGGAIELDPGEPPQRLAAFELEEGAITCPARYGASTPRRATLPQAILPVLEACDGTRTMGELLDAHGEAVGREALEDVLEALGPRDVGLLAPAWARKLER